MPPLYSYRCECNVEIDSYRTVADRHNAPLHCGKMMRQVIKPAMIVADIPEYLSPVTGKPVNGRRQRNEDLKRSGCRPWEGREVEQREANRYREEQDEKFATQMAEEAMKSISQLDADKQKILKN